MNQKCNFFEKNLLNLLHKSILIMKKSILLRTMLVSLLLLAGLSAHSQDYTSLTVREQSGTWTSFGLDGLKVLFTADNITVSNPDMTQTYAVSDLYSLMFTDLPTSVESQQESSKIVSLQSGRVYLKAKAGTVARVYNSGGQIQTSARIGQNGSPIVIGNLPPGIYMIKAGSETHKVLVK